MSIVRLIIEILQLFNVEVDENSILRIKDNDFSYIYDKSGEKIGKIEKKKNGFKVKILNEDYHLDLYSFKNEASYIKYKLYFMSEDKMLIGNTRVCFGKRYNDFVRKAGISIYENGENTNSYYSNSLENKFKLHNFSKIFNASILFKSLLVTTSTYLLPIFIPLFPRYFQVLVSFYHLNILM